MDALRPECRGNACCATAQVMRLGEIELERDPEALARECWKAWSPEWQFTEAEFAATAKSFHNPDWIATTLNCYRIWYGNAPGDPALQKYEDRLA